MFFVTIWIARNHSELTIFYTGYRLENPRLKNFSNHKSKKATYNYYKSQKRLSVTIKMTDSRHKKLRRQMFAIGACLGFVTSVILAFSNNFNMIGKFTFTCGIAWLILAGYFQFSTIKLRKLESAAIYILCAQYIFADLLNVLLNPFTGQELFIEFSGDLWVLTIIILLSFLFYRPKQALLLSSSLIALSVATVIFRSTMLVDGDTASVIKLVKQGIYFSICLYLIHTLSLFRTVAKSAKSKANEFEKLAYFDELTGIANRRKLAEVLTKEVDSARRYNTPLSIIIFDVDHFKKVNDEYGHNFGDLVLKEVSYSVANTVRSSDSLGRWGGEEFLCILPNTNATVAFDMAERLRIGIADSLIDNGPQITASFGIAQLLNLDNIDSFLNRADQALYSAKEQGRNRSKPNPLRDTSEVFITSDFGSSHLN